MTSDLRALLIGSVGAGLLVAGWFGAGVGVHHDHPVVPVVHCWQEPCRMVV